jgi:hypothetical protein
MTSVSVAVDLSSLSSYSARGPLETRQNGTATTLAELFRASTVEGSASEGPAQKRRKLDLGAEAALELANSFDESHSIVLANVDLQLVSPSLQAIVFVADRRSTCPRNSAPLHYKYQMDRLVPYQCLWSPSIIPMRKSLPWFYGMRPSRMA